MKIKKGDIVRVSEDVPKMYLRSMSKDFLGKDCKVYAIEGDNAAITSGPYYIAIPFKYLIKVDGEKKPKITIDEDAEMQRHEAFHQLMADCIAASKKYREENIKFMEDCMSGDIYTQSDFIKDYAPEKHEKNPNPRYIPKIMFNTKFWVKYEADLAREIALKVANRYNNPEETAKYAAKAAKQIVKHLKENK